jgi:hypothetical protein
MSVLDLLAAETVNGAYFSTSISYARRKSFGPHEVEADERSIYVWECAGMRNGLLMAWKPDAHSSRGMDDPEMDSLAFLSNETYSPFNLSE